MSPATTNGGDVWGDSDKVQSREQGEWAAPSRAATVSLQQSRAPQYSSLSFMSSGRSQMFPNINHRTTLEVRNDITLCNYLKSSTDDEKTASGYCNTLTVEVRASTSSLTRARIRIGCSSQTFQWEWRELKIDMCAENKLDWPTNKRASLPRVQTTKLWVIFRTIIMCF